MSAYQVTADPTNVAAKRIVAAIIDVGIAYVIYGILFAIFSEPNVVRFSSFNGTVNDCGGASLCSSIGDRHVSGGTAAVILLVFWGYMVGVFVLQRGLTGKTLGTMALGIVTVNDQGRPIGPGWALLRSVAGIVDYIPCCFPLVGTITIFATPGHRRVGDMAGKSFVVDKQYAGQPIVVPGVTASQPGGPYGQPYGQPPTYGQPTYGQPPGQPQYGQPEYGQPPGAPTGPWGAAPPAQQPYAQPSYGQPPAQPQYGAPPATPAPSTFEQPAAPPATPASGGWGAPGAADTPAAQPATSPAEAPASPDAAGWAAPVEPAPAAPEPAAQPAQPAEPAQPTEPAQPAAEPAASADPTQPQWDAARNAYIQWDPAGQRWLQYDDATQQWGPIT